MARARNIKPGFFANEELVDLPFAIRLLFIGLWTVADRAGRMEDKPKRIKMALFPADNFDVDHALSELERSGFIKRYEVEGTRYIQILAFTKHQNPHKDEKASLIPAPCEHVASTVQDIKPHSGNPADSLLLIPDPLIPDPGLIDIPPQASAPIRKKAKPSKTQIPEDFEISERVRVWAAKGGFTMLEQHLDAFIRKCKAKAYENVSWDDAFMEAVREDWAKLRGRVANGSAPPASHESADELESRAAVEKQAFSKGLHAWDALTEQWPAYKDRVLRAPRLPGISLDQLAGMALKRERAAV